MIADRVFQIKRFFGLFLRRSQKTSWKMFIAHPKKKLFFFYIDMRIGKHEKNAQLSYTRIGERSMSQWLYASVLSSIFHAEAMVKEYIGVK